jgi:hypothetical protein
MLHILIGVRPPAWIQKQWVRQKLRLRLHDLAVMSDGDLRLFEDGLRLVSRFKLTQEWQIAMTVVAAQVTRCLSAAWELFFLEYDTQPLALARLAGEYTLLMQYLETHRAEASAWLDPGAPTPMTAGEIAKRLEREGVETFPQSVRELLHRFSHQDTLAIGLTLSVKDSKKGQESWTLRIGDPSQNLRLVGSFLLIQDSLFLFRLHDFLGGLDDGWDRAFSRQGERHLRAMTKLAADPGATTLFHSDR